MSTRIPIYLIETEVGPGLPTQRTYGYRPFGKIVGYVVLPHEALEHECHEATMPVRMPPSEGDGYGRVAYTRLTPVQAIQAAIVGEHGLRWEAAGQSATTEDQLS